MPRLPSEKLQLCRGVGVGAGALAAALGLARAEAPDEGQRGLHVSSRLERLAADLDGSAATTIVPAADGGASHADQLIYSVHFTNTSGQVVDGVRITSAIPADLRYVPDSASGPASQVLYSVDHARSFGTARELTVVAASGAKRAADAADYTHVRWVFDGVLDVGVTGVVRFRAVPR